MSLNERRIREEKQRQIGLIYDARNRLDKIEAELATINARIAAAIAAHVAAENAELATTVPGWEERQRGEVE